MRIFRWFMKSVIWLHFAYAAFEDNFHIIDASAMKNMKDGVVIINTARGSLIDTKALIEALESGKVGAARSGCDRRWTWNVLLQQEIRYIVQKRSVCSAWFPECDRHAAYGVLYRSGCERYGKTFDRKLYSPWSRKERPVGGCLRKGDSDDLRERTCEKFWWCMCGQ